MWRRYRGFPVVPLGNGRSWLRFFLFNSGVGIGGGSRHLCTSSPNSANKAALEAAAEGGGRGMTRDEAYRQLHNLDFTTAARILFTAPPKKKKFGLDFHLVQLFFVCMPSLAVYLVAQYARYDIRRMEAEVELKRKQEEEEKAKEAEEKAKVKEAERATEIGSNSELVKVKVRLDVLEETVKEIADETRKISRSNLTKDQEGGKVEQPVLNVKNDSAHQNESSSGEVAQTHSGERTSPATNILPGNDKKGKGGVDNGGMPSQKLKK